MTRSKQRKTAYVGRNATPATGAWLQVSTHAAPYDNIRINVKLNLPSL